VVEGTVGYARRNFLVPVPQVRELEQLNEQLTAACRRDLQRRLRGQSARKEVLLGEDQADFIPLPPVPFDACRQRSTTTTSLSLARFEDNDYSVPVRCAHSQVVVKGYVDRVVICQRGEGIATHPRQWGRGAVVLEPVHYLALLERKPGALDAARPLEQWDLPACFALLRRRLEADLASGGTREFIKVLRLMERASLHELTGAVGQALSIGATGADAVGLILAHSQERPVGLFSLDGHPRLKSVVVDDIDLGAYRALTHIGATA